MSDDEYVLRFFGQIFTWVDTETDKAYHFNVDAMIKYAKAGGSGVELVNFEITPDDVKMIITKRGVDLDYCTNLLNDIEKARQPMVTIEFKDGDPPVHVTVDGHHRFVLWAGIGSRSAVTYMFKKGSWEQFTLDLDPESSRLLREELPP